MLRSSPCACPPREVSCSLSWPCLRMHVVRTPWSCRRVVVSVVDPVLPVPIGVHPTPELPQNSRLPFFLDGAGPTRQLSPQHTSVSSTHASAEDRGWLQPIPEHGYCFLTNEKGSASRVHHKERLRCSGSLSLCTVSTVPHRWCQTSGQNSPISSCCGSERSRRLPFEDDRRRARRL